ncbi:hypothetical protein ACU4GI_37215 [Cupriavidus basilensis]|uniref:hypothetical protein n=1 Tax=Cupriavidus sp. TaxID=1873897 RepID=UPI003D0F3D52
MSADERFIAGEDRLAALLREVPAFVPPASLEAAVMAAARAEQAARQTARQAAAPSPSAALPARVRAYAEQADNPAVDDELAFAPPAGLEASVMAEAARLQVAQAARRGAVLEEVRRGDAPQSVLGAPVSAAAQAWLREQAQAAQQASGEQAAAKPERARRTRRWWPALGVLAGALGVGVLSLQIVLRQLDLRDGGITLPAKAPATESAKRAPAAPAMHAEAGKPAAAPAQAASARQPASPQADAKAPPAPAAAPGPSAAQAPAASPAATANAQPSRAPAAEAQAGAAPRESDMLAEHRPAAARESAPAAAGSLSAGAPPAAAPVIRAPAPMASMAPMPPMASVAPPAPVAPIAPPAPAIEPPRFALRASPAPQAETARAPAARGQKLTAWTMSLREEPQLAVERLMSDAPGTGSAAGAPLALRITAAAPASPEVRAWVERLWQAVPAERRPPLPYAVQADSTLPPATVRIERQTDNAP